VKALLERGANPNRPHGSTLINAITRGRPHSLTIVKLLDEYGADLNKVWPCEDDGRPTTALSVAIESGQEEVAEYLRSRGAVLPPNWTTPSEGMVVAEAVDESEDAIADLDVAQELTDELVAYFSQHFGQPDKLSLIEIVPMGIPIAIHSIPASSEHNCVTLFTTGMASYPMKLPEGEEMYGRAELFIQLPPDWKYRELSDPSYSWPQRWLRSMAQYPTQHDTWLGGPVTLVANDDPPQPLAPNTRFTTLLLMAEREFTTHSGQTIWLYRMTPLYTEERDLEIREGISALLNAFDREGISFIVDLNRKNVAN
jgi:hypothetical protein